MDAMETSKQQEIRSPDQQITDQPVTRCPDHQINRCPDPPMSGFPDVPMPLLSCITMPTCFKCGTELQVNEEGIAPVLCDRCAGHATSRAQRSLSLGSVASYPVTTLLMAACIFVYVAMWITGGSSVTWGGNIGVLTLSGEYWRLVTAAFVHGGLLHIGFNMWCLYSLGRLSERLFGRLPTLMLFLLTGAGGSILSLAYDPMRNEVGASGAIFGLAGAILIGAKFGDLRLPEGEKRGIYSSMIFFVVINFWLGMGAYVDNMCHLGGFVSGLILGLPMATSFSSSKFGGLIRISVLTAGALLLVFAARELVGLHGHESRMIAARQYLGIDNFPAAISLLERDIHSGNTSASAYTLLGNIYEAMGQSQKSVPLYQRALALDPNDQNARDSLDNLTGKDGKKP